MNKKLLCVAAATAMGLASLVPAHAVTITGNITDTNLSDTTTDGSSYEIANGPYDFNAYFVGADNAGQANFKFTNSSANPVTVAVDFETVNEGVAHFANGVTTSWVYGGETHTTSGNTGTVDSFVLDSIIAPGGFDILKIAYGDPNQNHGVGPNFTLQVINAPLPLPGALPLFVSGLGALGFAGWRKRNTAKRAA